MAIIKVQNGTITDELYEDVAQPTYAKAHGYAVTSRPFVQDFICHKKICDVCGENLWRDDFIMWRGAGDDIAICQECAEHTINGLSRDVYELKGHHEARHQTGTQYGVEFLKGRITQLQQTNLKYTHQILQLQEILARHQ